MNAIRKYWDSVYIHILLIVPGLCMCAGAYWTIRKLLGFYEDLAWSKIILFDCSQLIYLAIAVVCICKNKKNVKPFIVLILFIQYNYIINLFASNYMWECTFIFFACIAFMFNSKLMFWNIVLYSSCLLSAHILRPELFLPMERSDIREIITYRIVVYILTSLCFLIIVYLVERFLILAQESDEENVRLMEKQLEYYKDMELMDTEIRKFRHDIKNHFMCMEMLFNSNKIEELQEYFQELQKDFFFEQKIYFSGNDIIDAILHHELTHHCREEVRVIVYGTLPKVKTVSAMDMCTVFSNLLSNAITSANRCINQPEPQIMIQFSGRTKYFSIAISNSVDLQMFAKSKKKDRNHGYGMYKIKNVLEKYGGEFEQSCEKNNITITVYLPI